MLVEHDADANLARMLGFIKAAITCIAEPKKVVKALVGKQQLILATLDLGYIRSLRRARAIPSRGLTGS